METLGIDVHSLAGRRTGAANVVGGYVGARTAVARGSAFVRIVFVLVSGALVIRLAAEVVEGLVGG